MNSGEGFKQIKLPEGFLYRPSGYLWRVLPLERFANLPTTIQVDGHTLAKKSEFHATVIHTRKVAEDIAAANAESIPKIEQELQKLLTEYLLTHPIELVHFENDLRLAKKSGDISIAARCTMRGLEGYFEKIREHYNLKLATQPAHVSLYTLSGGLAVGIDTPEEMESFKKVELPSVQTTLNSIS